MASSRSTNVNIRLRERELRSWRAEAKRSDETLSEWIRARCNPILSTRSHQSPDAHRDFDGFDVDEELRRLRDALRAGQLPVAAELAANLDEHLSRGGSLPVAWLGPSCMQEKNDLAARHQDARERAAKMSPAERARATTGYASVRTGR